MGTTPSPHRRLERIFVRRFRRRHALRLLSAVFLVLSAGSVTGLAPFRGVTTSIPIASVPGLAKVLQSPKVVHFHLVPKPRQATPAPTTTTPAQPAPTTTTTATPSPAKPVVHTPTPVLVQPVPTFTPIPQPPVPTKTVPTKTTAPTTTTTTTTVPPKPPATPTPAPSPKIDLNGGSAQSANALDVGTTSFLPGSSVSRETELANTGTATFSTITFTATVSASNALVTSSTNGLQMTIERCSTPWQATALPSGGWSYQCTGTEQATSAVPLSTVVSNGVVVAGLNALAPGGIDHLVVRLQLPLSAPSSFEGLSTTIGWSVTATGG